MTTERKDLDRRDFLKVGGAAAVTGALAAGRELGAADAPQAGYKTFPFAVAPIPQVRIGYVGVGLQGTGHVENLAHIPGCRVTAICDIDPARIKVATKVLTDAGHPAPKVYDRGPRPGNGTCRSCSRR
jgi:hypothetical protein